MHIDSIELKNWRNFQKAKIELQQRTFLVGPNASGKSNFLDAMRFLRDLAQAGSGGLQQAVVSRGGLSRIRCLAARTDPKVEIKVSMSADDETWRYELALEQEIRGHRRPIIALERVTHNGTKIIDRPDSKDRKDPELLTQTHIEQINANVGFREMAAFFQSIRYLHLVPQLVRNREYFGGKIVPLDPYGQTLLERIARINETSQRSRLGKIETALKSVVPQLAKLQLKRDEIGVPHLEAIYEHWRAHGAKQREDQFSDGTLRLIGLFWSLLEDDDLMLLEEPELSLNTEIVRKLPTLINKVQKSRKKRGAQTLISTHSYEILSDKGIGLDEVVLLVPGENGTELLLAKSNKDIAAMVKQGMSVGEAVLPRTAPAGIYELDLKY